MRFLYLIIKNAQIGHQLSQIAWLEVAGFKLDNNQTVQLAVKKQQVRKKLMCISFQVILIAYKCEIMTKSHDELLDIMDNAFFNDTFVYIRRIAYANLLCIDKIKEIFIFKHVKRSDGILRIMNCSTEI